MDEIYESHSHMVRNFKGVEYPVELKTLPTEENNRELSQQFDFPIDPVDPEDWQEFCMIWGIPFDWQEKYSDQRKDRMQDAIDDYLNDDQVDARRAYEEILSCVDDVINHHKKQYDKAVELKSLLLGNRDCDLLACADSLATAE